MTQMLRALDLEKILKALFENYPRLLKNVFIASGPLYNEQICGTISDKINRFLRKELGIDSKEFSGFYYGIGTEHSGRHEGTNHYWVEFQYLDEWAQSHFLIIDGAYAQFLPKYTPMALKDRIRLTIFFDDPVARTWYEGKPSTFNYKLKELRRIGVEV